MKIIWCGEVRKIIISRVFRREHESFFSHVYYSNSVEFFVFLRSSRNRLVENSKYFAKFAKCFVANISRIVCVKFFVVVVS